MSTAIKAPNLKSLSPKEIEVILLVSGGIIVVYLGYKVYKLIAGAADEGADLLGKGTEGKTADKKQSEIDALKPENNPFSWYYLHTLKGQNPGKDFAVLSNKTKENLQKFIANKLSLGTTYVHPLNYKQNREDVIKLMKSIFTHKTQVSDFAGYFERKEKVKFFDFINDGFRNTGWTSGSDYQKMFSDFVSFVQNLPQ